MTHPSEEELLAHLDGELNELRAGAVAEHLGGCLPCHRRMKALRSTLHDSAALIRRLDEAEPQHWAASPAPRPPVPAAAGVPRTARHARRPGMAVSRWAAGVALLLAAAGASATLLTRHGTGEAVPPASPDAPSGIEALPAPVGALIVRPSDDTVRVVIRGGGPDVFIRAAMHARSEVTIAIEGSSAPRFTARDGLVAVTLEEPGARVEVWFPHTLRSGSVLAEGRERVRVLDGRIVPAPGGGTPYATEPR